MILVLVIMMLSMTLVAALLVHAGVSVRTEGNYKVRTERLGHAEDAMAFTLSVLRHPAAGSPGTTLAPDGSLQDRTNLLGLAGTTLVRTSAGFTVTCTGDPGSGIRTADGTYADRSVTCTDQQGAITYHFQATILDVGGTNLGSAVQVRTADFDDH